MSLSDDDKRQLKSLLERNRQGRNPDGSDNWHIRVPTTDESVALVRHGLSKDHRVYHAYADGGPACRTEIDGKYIEWDIEMARAWMPACSRCYPEGDGE